MNAIQLSDSIIFFRMIYAWIFNPVSDHRIATSWFIYLQKSKEDLADYVPKNHLK